MNINNLQSIGKKCILVATDSSGSFSNFFQQTPNTDG